MKKLALLTLSSFLILGACRHSNDTVKDVNDSAHKKNNPNAHLGHVTYTKLKLPTKNKSCTTL